MTIPPVDPNLEQQVSEKPPLRDDTRFAAGKIAIFQYATVAIFLFLISGFWRLQVQNQEIYDEKAQANSIKSVPVLAPRGRILDRDGRVIVDNHSSFTLILARELVKEEHLRPIAQGLDLDYTDLADRFRKLRKEPKYRPMVLKEELSPGDLAFVASHHDFFPELVLIQAQRRLYPQNGMMAHVIGYTGEISDEELDMPEFARYKGGDVIGKFGIERQYNDMLMGVDGQRQVVVDNRGQVRKEIGIKPAIPGKDLQLTIDLDLQAVAELAMEGKNGAVVALDPRNGQVLAMVSRPAFDPNKFAVHIKSKDWREIADNPDKPMFNRAIQAAEAPGSTFKPIMAIAGLETGTIDDSYTVRCPGGATFYGRYYKCHEKGGHGSVQLHKAIVMSCDVFFYTVGNKMGIDPIAFYGDLVGYGHTTGIDLPHEAAGVMPSKQWKQRNYHEPWYAGEVVSVSIGQGYLTVTPIEMARAIAGLANGGVWHRPHLTKDGDKNDKPVEWKLDPAHLQDVISGMFGVVNEGGGTGGRARLAHIEVCGKTGTAQVASLEFTKSRGSDKNFKDNGWFVGFAPRAAPEILVVALFEHAGSSTWTVPIARDVLKAYFDKKTRLAQGQQAPITAVNLFPEKPGARGQEPGNADAPVEVAYMESAAPSSADQITAASQPRLPAPDPRPRERSEPSPRLQQ